jgi:NhaP-type Na+/H+ or K+/H+ antiporter
MELHPYAVLTLTAALAIGVIGQAVARLLTIPGIIVLLMLGVALGPEGLALVQPSYLGDLIHPMVALAVAVIVFEGGLHLDARSLRREALVIRRLITIGALVTAGATALAAALLMDLSWKHSLLFGTLVIVTGPTVVAPLLRRINVRPQLRTILEAESVLIDPVGAILAAAALDLVLLESDAGFAATAIAFGGKLAIGFGIGLGGGWIIGRLLRWQRAVPDELENIFVLSFVLFFHEVSNAILHESGIMAVTVAGVVVGNMRLPHGRRIREFKEQLTTMLIGMLFVLLTASVELSDVQALGWPGAMTVFAVIFLVRPLNVFVSTYGSQLGKRERLFMCWMAPRGIVAAAVASLFADSLASHGLAGGSRLRALVFAVIATTVLSQGVTAGFVARLLRVRQRSRMGYVIVGAGALGRRLATELGGSSSHVILIDRNPDACALAADAGLEIVEGNALEEATLVRTIIDSRIGILCVTPNDGINLVVFRRAREISKELVGGIVLHPGGAVPDGAAAAASARLLFGGRTDNDAWERRLRLGDAETRHWRSFAAKPIPIESLMQVDGDAPLLPLVVQRSGRVVPVFADDAVATGDVLVALVDAASSSVVSDHLSKLGLFRLDEAASSTQDQELA